MYFNNRVNRNVSVRKTVFPNPKDKQLRVAAIGDIHLSRLVGMNDVVQILELLKEVKSDYICLLGDLIDSPTVLYDSRKVDELLYLVEECSKIAPTMIVLGNHDFINQEILGFPSVLKDMNIWNELDSIKDVHFLNNTTYTDGNVFFGGYLQPRESYFVEGEKYQRDAGPLYDDLKKQRVLLNDLPSDMVRVLLTHSLEYLGDTRIKELLVPAYNLVLGGHDHNGCVPTLIDGFWPGNGGIISPKKQLFPKQVRGIVKADSCLYYVYSGGWSKITACAPSALQFLNFFCDPQIDIIDFIPGGQYQTENKRYVLRKHW